MTRRADIAANHAPVFVTADEAARRMMVHVDKFRELVRRGVVPSAAISLDQTVRWHWPSIEAALVSSKPALHDDPFMAGIEHVKTSQIGRRRRATPT
jgi:hypothetical protein